MKFTKELKDKWIAALRSGEFEQNRGSLYWKGKYCCLGVLAKVSGLNEMTWESEGCIPSTYVLLDEAIGGHWVSQLAGMNDNLGASFSEIADYVDINVPSESSD